MDPFQTASSDIDCLRLICATPLHFGSTSCCQGKAEMNHPTCTLHLLHCFALHLSPPLSLSVASRKPVTNQRRICQRVGFFACPLWDTEDAAHANAHACGAACPSKGAAVRCGEGVPCSNLPHALGFRCLPLLRRSTVSGQLSVPFCIGRHPRRINAASGHDSETFDHFC